ncbi:DNA-binding protein [Xanthomonas fragariae]|nr:DNA-binding protein [Xanthomonas fragariae]
MAITKDQIWKIADQLDADGVKPTLSAVCKKLAAVVTPPSRTQ